MSAPAPILCQWDGESFTPVSQTWARRADQHYVVGERYTIAPVEERSQRSHNHFFAVIADAWRNLPEEYADQFPSETHFRRWLLIKAGYRDERTIVCASNAEAQRVAAFIKPLDEYAVVVVRDSVVIHWTAKSQSARAMKSKEFQASKEACFDVLAKMLGTTAGALKQNAKDAA
jgi:hypothetical protein